MLSVSFCFLVFLSSHYKSASCCNEAERDSLLLFYRSISSPPPSALNWSESTNCCLWQGITCTPTNARVTHLWLPEKRLSGSLNTSFLANLPFLKHLNLSHNRLSGPLPSTLSMPQSIRTLDLSSNRFNGSLDPRFLLRASNLMSFNISNNSFTGSIPTSSICKASTLIISLDFSMNHFSGPLSPGVGQCPNLQVLRAGANSLSGWLPYDLYNATKLREISLHNNQFSGPINGTIVTLSNLTILDLHFNQLSGDIPQNIGLLSNLESLILHTNTLHGSLPPSLMNCTRLRTLLLRDNNFGGDVSHLNFSKLLRLQAIDLGSNTFTGSIPQTLCSCTSLVAVRFSHNQLSGEIPPCMASLASLQHLALANNNLSNIVGAFKILSHCHNLAVLILWASFHDETMPTDNDLSHSRGFQNLQILTLGDCKLKGHIPTWIANMKELKQLDLSKNEIRGTIPSWLGSMPSLCILNLTQNLLWGHLPLQLTQMPALAPSSASSPNNATLDLSYLQLPLLIDGRQYSRLYNLRRGLAVGSNSLCCKIPPEIGKLKLLQVLDLSNNQFIGGIPPELAALTNLESLNLSENRLSGKIPESLRGLYFLSWLSVANNDLEGEIPRGSQFDTFPPNSFEGNPKLCGFVINRRCSNPTEADKVPAAEGKNLHISWYSLPFGLGYSLGLFAVTIATFFKNA